MEKIKVEKTASRGIAVAKIYKYGELDLKPVQYKVPADKKKEQLDKFLDARECVRGELEELAASNEIFSAHMEMVMDFTLEDSVTSKINNNSENAETAVSEAISEVAAVFGMMDDEYMKERAADIQDVGKRLMAQLKGIKLPDIGSLDEEAIILAKDLFPSDTVKINTDYVKGIITEEGGVTSHVSIIAKNLGIPTLVGVKGIFNKLNTGDMVCMDASEGVIVLFPEDNITREYEKKKQEFQDEKLRLEKLRDIPVITKDGKKINICINAGNADDIERALPVKMDGTGLFRSELLYMENTHFPTEEEQFEVYKRAAELCPQELTIRTLDIGGDKELPYFDFEKEDNPFLGWRAIRISLDMKDMFKEQLRAILRSRAFGNVRIMFPMIISLEELREAKAVVEECKNELREECKKFCEDIETGIMMETPASVLLAEQLAKESSFFSIGTNDLTQYLLAVDRGNKKIADKYSYFHPAVLSAIKHIINAGHKENIKVGMCGEMAGDIKATEILLDYGLDEFSMSAGSVDYVREKILKIQGII